MKFVNLALISLLYCFAYLFFMKSDKIVTENNQRITNNATEITKLKKGSTFHGKILDEVVKRCVK
jgi:hypothetical protein